MIIVFSLQNEYVDDIKTIPYSLEFSVVIVDFDQLSMTVHCSKMTIFD